MINRWVGDIALLFQAKTGVTSALIVWAGVVVIASLAAFVFLCVTGYDWLSLQLGATFSGLAMASVFLVIALIGAAFCAASRRRAKQRAMLARAARARGAAARARASSPAGAGMERCGAPPVVLSRPVAP